MKNINAIIACAALIVIGSVAANHKVNAGEVLPTSTKESDSSSTSIGVAKLAQGPVYFNWGVSNKVIRPK